MTTDRGDLLDSAGVAALLGIAVGSVARYRGRGELPEPDVRLGRSPGWYEATIREWQAARPGRTGRPGTAKVRVRSWECVIGRDRVCRRGDDPDHDPKKAPPEFSTAGFALCLRDPHCLRCAEPWTLLDTNKTAWPCGHAQLP